MAPTVTPIKASGIVEDKSHQAVSSYFIGPQAENLRDFKENIGSILNELEKTKKNYFPTDDVCISLHTRTSRLDHPLISSCLFSGLHHRLNSRLRDLQGMQDKGF
jgi:hypothetical protein